MSSKQPPLERDARLQETRCLFLPGLVAVRDGRTAAGPGISDEASTTHVSCADGTHSVGSGLLRLPPPLPPFSSRSIQKAKKEGSDAGHRATWNAAGRPRCGVGTLAWVGEQSACFPAMVSTFCFAISYVWPSNLDCCYRQRGSQRSSRGTSSGVLYMPPLLCDEGDKVGGNASLNVDPRCHQPLPLRHASK
ncbi:hypothetical protein B296_00033646 [Ensete ventricosum]|uniref:Uncharacterized protein n=1 Tax=Ensete ventricosum TaxID=4639 RepID=A0A426XV20_ENSVE|nr:hypothetical protein B296_00033646 [Ensete ventricosum]